MTSAISPEFIPRRRDFSVSRYAGGEALQSLYVDLAIATSDQPAVELHAPAELTPANGHTCRLKLVRQNEILRNAALEAYFGNNKNPIKHIKKELVQKVPSLAESMDAVVEIGEVKTFDTRPRKDVPFSLEFDGETLDMIEEEQAKVREALAELAGVTTARLNWHSHERDAPDLLLGFLPPDASAAVTEKVGDILLAHTDLSEPMVVDLAPYSIR